MRSLALAYFVVVSLALPCVGAQQSPQPEHCGVMPLAAEPANTFYARPLPAIKSNAPTALSYHQIPIVHDSLHDEPLVDVSKYGIAGEDYYARTDRLNPPYLSPIEGAVKAIRCRRSVAQKLAAINAKLAPLGVEVYIYDAYRPVVVQRSLWTYFLDVARTVLKTTDEAALSEYAGRFCSDPSRFDSNNESTYPTHTTGGAVDLTLRNIKTHELLFMGTIFDEASPSAYSDHFEANDESASATEARRNRRLLYWAMRSEGFANYPYEWWHYDWGNQMWVQNSAVRSGEQPHASYGLPPGA